MGKGIRKYIQRKWTHRGHAYELVSLVELMTIYREARSVGFITYYYYDYKGCDIVMNGKRVQLWSVEDNYHVVKVLKPFGTETYKTPYGCWTDKETNAWMDAELEAIRLDGLQLK